MVSLFNQIIDDLAQSVSLTETLLPVEEELLGDDLLQVLHVAALLMDELLYDLQLELVGEGLAGLAGAVVALRVN